MLREAVGREAAGWADGELSALGATLGKPETIQLGFDANKFTPQLRTLDRYGHRIDEVDFHPAWHELLGIALKAGLHSSPWAEPKPGAHVARAAGTYMLGQIESGVYCPVAMTYGSVPTLRHAPAIAAEWLPRIFSRDYDRRFRPARLKSAALIGMGMTENQGGSDLRTNTTRAEPAGDGTFRLYGHKWFMSAPMCDAFLVLAQSPKGLSCFFMPRWTPEGERNGIHILRLKDKLGNRSNASSEVEFHGAYAQLVGEEGRGIPTIIEMGNYTRLDCCIGSSALMRQAVAQAIHHARHRTAFQKKLIDQPLMTNVLADLAIESEAALALTMRLARAYDERRRSGTGHPSRGDAGSEILDLQADAVRDLRGDGGAGRFWLHRGMHHAAALPRGAGQLDLGRLGQRHVSRCVACDGRTPNMADVLRSELGGRYAS